MGKYLVNAIYAGEATVSQPDFIVSCDKFEQAEKAAIAQMIDDIYIACTITLFVDNQPVEAWYPEKNTIGEAKVIWYHRTYDKLPDVYINDIDDGYEEELS